MGRGGRDAATSAGDGIVKRHYAQNYVNALAIDGFEEPTLGTVYLGGRDVTDLPRYKRDVNTVFQSHALFPHLSVFDNVAFGLRRSKVASDDVDRRVKESKALVDLIGFEERRPPQMSRGQQQRVALARAFVNSPKVRELPWRLLAGGS